ncbi:MAG: glycoside hydrolase family 2 TIM barrel-domain containing protein [Candidatus Latescibacterota bacterium]|jgi:hypothetical protein
MQGSATRLSGPPVQSLGGTWRAALDPTNTGIAQHWFAAMRPEAAEAPVPGVVDLVFPTATGVVWYWRTFRPERLATPVERYLLCFGAAKYLARVWVNGQEVGTHEGGETPFTLDVTAAVRPATDNLLAVRLLNPTDEPLDGMVLAEVPSSNRRAYCGMVLPVELRVVPAVRLVDLFARPHLDTGEVRLEVTVRNGTDAEVRTALRAFVGPAATGERLDEEHRTVSLPVGDSLQQLSLRVARPRAWDLGDPFLYQVRVELAPEADLPAHGAAVRCGFRDFRVEDGYFRLNGRRVFLRSTHTGNHFPIGHIAPHEPDLWWRDLLYAKAAGFNMVRFIASTAAPEQLDYCDQLGLMVYEESAAAWGLGDSPQLAQRFDRSVAEVIRRDRNHPSVTVWGLLNETPDGPVFRHAAAMLPLIRSLDPSRLVLLSSGRHDAQPRIGSLCNPDRDHWEYQWGREGPEAVSAGVELAQCSGYADGLGDVHVYLASPHPVHRVRFVRELARDSAPIFLSEYGVNSLLDVVGGTRLYEQSGARPDLPEAALFRSILERLERDWERLGMSSTYPFLRDLLRDSQRRHARQRLAGLDMIRSNPRICGHNLTGMLDHGVTGEGLWTFWREWKPGIVDALTDGWAPLRWCLFAEPRHGYAGRPFSVEVVLANEDVLGPGRYPVCLRVHGDQGTVWERCTEVVIPDPSPGRDGPLAVPVFAGEVVLSVPAGEYLLAAEMMEGGCPAGGRLSLHVAAPAALPAVHAEVALWGVDARAAAWLQAQGLRCRRFTPDRNGSPELIVVGQPEDSGAVGWGPASGPVAWQALARRLAQGSVALFLSPLAFRRGDQPLAWLPLELGRKGRCDQTPDYNYIKECVAAPHPIFAGLQGNGIMDWDYYGPLLSPRLYEEQETPDEVAAAGFIVGHANYADRYTAGVVIGAYRFGAGWFALNTLNLLQHLDRHPAADRLVLNLLSWGATRVVPAPADLPEDFAARLAAIGYA